MTYIFSFINGWFWLGLSFSLIILEVLLGVDFFILWLGISAATVSLVMFVYPQLIWEYQFILFSVQSVVCIFLWGLRLKRNQKVSSQYNLNRRNEQYIGRVVTLLDPIVNGRGRIHVDDSFWIVEGPDLAAGVAVKIIGADGVVLKIEKN